MHRDHLVERAVQRASEVAAGTGAITFEQLNALLPADQFKAEHIEELLKRLSDKDIHLIED